MFIIKLMTSQFKSVVYTISNIPELKDFINGDYETSKNNIIVKSNITKNQSYSVIQNDKKSLTNDKISEIGLLRSVVLNNHNHVLSFAPPKSVPFNDFIDLYSFDDQNIIIEEFVEGTMIQLFWNDSINDWEITSRSKVGGETSFFFSDNRKTFRTMFLESADNASLDFELLDKKYCYSFVFKHPENMMVQYINEPELFLIDVFEIENLKDGTINVYKFSSDDVSTAQF